MRLSNAINQSSHEQAHIHTPKIKQKLMTVITKRRSSVAAAIIIGKGPSPHIRASTNVPAKTVCDEISNFQTINGNDLDNSL